MINVLSRPLLRTYDHDRSRLTKPSARLQQALSVADQIRQEPQSRFNITVSHSHRLVWFRVAKVGTRSIFGALRSAGVQLDLEEPYGVVEPRALTRGYLRAGFVRHPIDRFLSAWQSTVVKLNHFNFDDRTYAEMQDLSTFVEWFAELDPETCDAHLRAQSALLPNEPLDLLGRMETFDRDLNTLLERIGAPGSSPNRLNASPDSAPSLNAAERRLLIDRYFGDFERFGYEVR